MTKPMQQDASELKNAITQEVDNSNTNIPESNQAISSPKTQEDPQPTKQTYKFYTTPNPTEEPMQGYPSKRRGLRNKPVSTNTSYQVLPRQNVTQDSTLSPEIEPKEIQGILDVMPEGHGYVRPKFSPSSGDAYISQSQIRRFNLRAGDYVEGLARPPKERERYHGFLEAKKVNGKSLSDEFLQRRRTRFEELTAIYPNTRLTLEHGKTPLSCRIIDLVSPIGKGQRAMIVSPPKAGKTTVMKDIAFGVTSNFPNVHIIAALIGERPEEVTDIQRNVKGEVIASNFDEPPEEQCRVAEIAIERAKRLVEEGRDVVILLDSITRLARAYNLTVPPSGRTLSGGFDPAALYPPKKFFGAARNCEEGGSLTIIATALVDTGSRMDELIYEEFKGTGNMELHLDRKLAEKRIFPSIDVNKSGTRREELLFSDEVYRNIVTMRRMLSMLGDDERTEVLVERLNKSQSNEEFLNTLKG